MEARKLGAAAESPFQLSLRIRHPSIDPAEISRELHLQADHSFRAGEPRKSASGVATASVHSESYWLAALDTRPWTSWPESSQESGSKRLMRIRDFIDSYASSDFGVVLARWMLHLRMHAAFMRRIHAEGGQVRLLIAIAPRDVRGFVLTPDFARLAGDLRVAIDFEFASD
jgi:hypothetical protein